MEKARPADDPPGRGLAPGLRPKPVLNPISGPLSSPTSVPLPDPAQCPLPGLVLAAGFSRRMGVCKLSLPWQGESLVNHSIRAGREAGLCPLLLVSRKDADPVLQASLHCQSLFPGTERVEAEKAAQGQAESLKAGIRRLLELESQGRPFPGVAVLLGDQPLIRAPLIRSLAEIFLRDPSRPVAPVFQGQRGHPVFLPRRVFEKLLTLRGDEGARSLLVAFGLLSVPVEDGSILADIDTQDAYEYLLTSKDRLS